MPKKIKLYKFRSLTNEDPKRTDIQSAIEIVSSGKFWHADFSSLNDPMEGSFSTISKDPNLVSDLYSNKTRYKLCSFSSKRAFANPLMWAHYANGFKGLAIEIEVNINNEQIRKINYTDKKFVVENAQDTINTTLEILTTKLDLWKHEFEYRSLLEKEKPFPQKVGTITAIYFGYPYEDADNRKYIYSSSKSLKRLEKEKKQLLKLASEKKIPCYSVKIQGGVVVTNKKLHSQ